MKIRELVTIGKDIELIYAQSGTAIAKTSIAVTRNEKVNGEWTNITDWYNIVAFGKTAERLSNYVQKGHRILLDGVLKQGEYTKQDGTKVRTYDIVVDNFTFIEKSQGKSQPSSSYQQPQQKQQPKVTVHDMPMQDNEEIPF